MDQRNIWDRSLAHTHLLIFFPLCSSPNNQMPVYLRKFQIGKICHTNTPIYRVVMKHIMPILLLSRRFKVLVLYKTSANLVPFKCLTFCVPQLMWPIGNSQNPQNYRCEKHGNFCNSFDILFFYFRFRLFYLYLNV